MAIKKIVLATAALLIALGALPAGAQIPPAKPAGPPPQGPPRVFLDWPGADVGFFRAEIPFVEFVSSLEEAQVRVIVTPQGPPGAETFVLALSGLKEFEGDDNTLTHAPAPGEGPGDVRQGLAGVLKLGLMRYVAKTPAAKFVSVNFQDAVKPTAVVDKWDFWVFSFSASSFLMGETQYKDGMSFGSFSASRVTPELKVQTSVYGHFQKMRFDFGDDIYESESHGYGFSGLAVKSLSEYWSAGAFSSVESSTFSNTELAASVAPAVEYNFYPYSESTRKQLRILYRIGYTYAKYFEETIYFKTSENLFQEALTLAYEVKQPWGTVSLELEASHYFHDFSKNRIELRGDLSVRIWKGLSFEVDGGYARIRDLLSLSAEGASYEEILLRQRQLETGYSYSFSAGLSFTFGSTKSNVVNPRFGNGGRNISIGL